MARRSPPAIRFGTSSRAARGGRLGAIVQPIEFMGFSGDCIVYGRMTLTADRLTDELNAAESFRLEGVTLEDIGDGHAIVLPELVVDQADLFAAIATGPRGNESRRVRTRTVRMQLSLGPFMVLGNLHTQPGADPLTSVMRRSPMIPLTNATIAFAREGFVIARDAETLLVNRNLADQIRPTGDEALLFPDATIIAA
jgi:hypothetical protein